MSQNIPTFTYGLGMVECAPGKHRKSALKYHVLKHLRYLPTAVSTRARNDSHRITNADKAFVAILHSPLEIEL